MKGLNPVQLIERNYLDGWYNVLTGSGMLNRDKKVSTAFSSSGRLDDMTLSDIYRSEGLGTNIIDIPIGDMLRKGFYIENDGDNKIIRYLNKKQYKKFLKKAITWGDLFGGAVLFMGINDGQSADKPVNKDTIVDITFFEVYDRRSIQWMPEDLFDDPNNPKYGKPEIYTLINRSTGKSLRVHDSRIIRFNGKELPDDEMIANNGWGDSILQKLYSRLKGLGSSLDGVETINEEFILSVLKVTGLQNLLATDQGNATLQRRIQALDLSKNILNTVVVDAAEEYERVTSIGVSGLRELVDVLIDFVCGLARIPRMRLLGDQSKGLGGEAGGTIRDYYDDISSRQDDDLRNPLSILCEYASYAIKYKEKDIYIVFNPLWEATEKEIAETRLINAKADVAYMEHGLPPEYVFLGRFGGQTYSNSLTLPKEYVDLLKKVNAQELLERQQEFLENENEPNTNKEGNSEEETEE